MDKPYVLSRRIDHARTLRTQSTDVEKRLWYRIRGRQISGCKFRRQHPVGQFILDFACEEWKLAIELDGGQHNLPKALHADMRRTALLAEAGWTLVRFWNHEVLENMEGVLETIQSALTRRAEEARRPLP